MLSRGKAGPKPQGLCVALEGDGKGARWREGQREGWSQDEGTCAAEDALMSGIVEDHRGCSSMSAEARAGQKTNSMTGGDKIHLG